MRMNKESVIPACCQWSVREKAELRITDSAVLPSWPGERYVSDRGFIADSLLEVQTDDKAETQGWKWQKEFRLTQFWGRCGVGGGGIMGSYCAERKDFPCLLMQSLAVKASRVPSNERESRLTWKQWGCTFGPECQRTFVLPCKSSWKEPAKAGLLSREMQMWRGVRTLFHDLIQRDRLSQTEGSCFKWKRNKTPFIDKIEICLFSQPELGIMRDSKACCVT